MKLSIDRLIKLIPEWKGKLIKVNPINSGITNINFEVTVGKKKYFLSMPSSNSKLLNIDYGNKFYNNKIYISAKKKYYFKEKKFNIYCYLNKKNKKIALTKNKNLSFLANFKMPEAQMVISNNNLKIKGWNYLCNYKNNISNIKMNINLFYKFTVNKPKKFTWYSIDGSNVTFIPSFTKKIFKKVKKLYV